jgi:hypothetical protein
MAAAIAAPTQGEEHNMTQAQGSQVIQTVVMLRDAQGQAYLFSQADVDAARVTDASQSALDELVESDLQGFVMVPPQYQFSAVHSFAVAGGLSSLQQRGIIIVSGRRY